MANGRPGVEITNPATPPTQASHNQSFHRIRTRFVSCKAENCKQQTGIMIRDLQASPHAVKRQAGVKQASSFQERSSYGAIPGPM